MMNEIAKKRIQEKLEKAMIEESLKLGQVAKFLNLNPVYISMIKNEGHWKKCSRKAWEKVLEWINTGLSMEAYAKVQDKIKEENKGIKIQGNSIWEDDKSVTLPKSTEDSNVPEVLKTNTSLIDLLKTERLSLENRIQAIDTLLESY